MERRRGGYGGGFRSGGYGGGGGFRGGGGGGFSPVKVGDELTLKIEAVGEKGDGIAKVKGFVIFVPGTKAGDEVKVKITKVFRKVGFGEVVGASSGSSEGTTEGTEQAEGSSEQTEESTEESTEETKEEEPAYEETSDSEEF